MIPLLILVENVLAVGAQLFLRRGAVRLEHAPLAPSILLEPFRNPYILSGLLLHGLSFFLYIFVLAASCSAFASASNSSAIAVKDFTSESQC